MNALKQDLQLNPYDVTLIVKDGKEFKAHRQVLSEASPFFEKLLSSDMNEKNGRSHSTGDIKRVSDGGYSGVYLRWLIKDFE